jgi:hypothetical protein
MKEGWAAVGAHLGYDENVGEDNGSVQVKPPNGLRGQRQSGSIINNTTTMNGE